MFFLLWSGCVEVTYGLKDNNIEGAKAGKFALEELVATFSNIN